MILLSLAIAALVFGCSKPPPSQPTKPSAPPVDATWKIIGHVMTDSALIDEKDAVGWNGREIAVTQKGYQSPFQGTCVQAARTRRTRSLADVVMEKDAPRSILTDYELADEVTEYKLTCRERERPPLEMWVDGDRALTCYGGVCYILRR